MTNTLHTPSPWRLEKHPHNDTYAVVGADGYIVSEFDAPDIANAYLVREAPEMLSWLEAALTALPEADHALLVDGIRQVVARARGLS